MANSTVTEFGRVLRRLSKVADLNNPETIKEALAKMEIDENTKATYCAVYTSFLKSIGKTWKPPKYTFRQKLPEFLPTEGRKLSTLLQLIKETGMRMGEAVSLTWLSISFETNTITLSVAEKRSLPRIFRVSQKLMTMLGNLPKQNEKVFGRMKKASAINNFYKQRKTLAVKLANPRIGKIHFHLIRHWYGTNEYHKKPDMDHVRRLLGHKSILSTQIYVNMEQAIFKSSVDEYVVKVASTMEEIVKLTEVGFEVVTEFEGKEVLKKRK
jgi:integrase